MNLVCIVFFACMYRPLGPAEEGEPSCTIVQSDCMFVTELGEKALRGWCDASSSCAEPRRGTFAIRRRVTPEKTWSL